MLQRDKGVSRDPLYRDFKFPLGQVNLTPLVKASVPPSELFRALRRHALGDWGDLDSAQRAQNDKALADGGQLVSEYRTKDDKTIWVITEADRAWTTVLLPRASARARATTESTPDA